MCWGLSFNEVAGLRSGILFEKKLQQQGFSFEFPEISKSSFFIEHQRWLLMWLEL